jgi:leucyl aminopeptidase
MKKDMGGAANVLGLADMVMGAGLALRLRVLIPAVENMVSGDAFRPGDVLRTRKGKTVEVGNTDAEGRIILADALAEADCEGPDLLLDMATLTGAARVAVGPDLPALFTDDDRLAQDLAAEGGKENDPIWRLPLFGPYAEGLKSRIADLNNVADSPMAGSVTAALFLKSFVTESSAWGHLDVYAWNDKARPGRPVGGEAQAIRALYRLLEKRYAKA